MATTTEKKVYGYENVAVTVEDNRNKWEAGKDVTGCIVKYTEEGNKMTVIVPEPVKRDTTKNPALVIGPKTGMQVTVHKDGSYGFSWTPKVGEMRLIGLNKTVQEFKECMKVYFEKIGA